MKNNRIKEHPILKISDQEELTFYWNSKALKAKKGEVISSALFANGVKIFGHHPKDGSAQGIYCANGQCAKCTVIANGVPVKSCMVEVNANMLVTSVEGLPELPEIENNPQLNNIETISKEVLIIGGGPSGLAAAIELGKKNIKTLIVDDKLTLGGKLVLQTHKFFGSVKDSFAGTRGNDIGKLLEDKVRSYDSIEIWTNSTALYVFNDSKVGIVRDGVYKIVSPEVILNAAGAREKFLRFKGNTLAGIYGAGAFQTLVNRDLVKPADKLFIVGGGNVGLIAGYHALQAGINVVGLVEALPQCGGYKVHADKLKRLGVPIYTSHTVVQAIGEKSVSEVKISEIDRNFKPVPGTDKTFQCDTILIAVGLEPVSEFAQEAERAGIKVYSAGDALEIAEASSAMFNGRITGIKIANELGSSEEEIPNSWYQKAEVLKSEPGKIVNYDTSKKNSGIFPIIHCIQEIPCNPCSTICPTGSINIEGDPILGIPKYEGSCVGCGKCVAICPGLAITLVDFRKDEEHPIVTLPYEVSNFSVAAGDLVQGTDINGKMLGSFEVIKVLDVKANNRTQLIKIKAEKQVAAKIVSFEIQNKNQNTPPDLNAKIPDINENEMVCICERVTAKEVLDLIRKGITDLNQIKAITRAGMGPCGAKTCDNLIKQLFRMEGIDNNEIEPNTRRPLFVEIPLGTFAGENGGNDE